MMGRLRTLPRGRSGDSRKRGSFKEMTTSAELNRTLKLLIQSGLGNDDTPSIKLKETEEMMELVDMLTPLLVEYRTKTVILGLAFLISEQLDMIEARKKEGVGKNA
jgi:hypothetical protein